MTLRMVWMAALLAGLSHVSAAWALTVTPVESRIFLETRVGLGTHRTVAQFRSDEQESTLRPLSASAVAMASDGPASLSVHTTANATWKSPAEGRFEMSSWFDGVDVESAYFSGQRMRGTEFGYSFMLSEPAMIRLRIRTGIRAGSMFNRYDLGGTSVELRTGNRGQYFFRSNEEPGWSVKFFGLAAGVHSVSVYGGISKGNFDHRNFSGTQMAGFESLVDWSVAKHMAIPLPFPLVLLLSGLGGLGLVARRGTG